MGKLIVLTNPDMAAGFRLAGADVVIARTQEQAQASLQKLISQGGDDVVAVDGEYLAGMPEELRRRIEEVYRPLVVGIPKAQALRPEERQSYYIRELIRRAIGFQIAFGEGKEKPEESTPSGR